ncbi:hypothetical protein LINPERHAP1_LOCUS13495 [Linum perenne]
MPLRVKYIYNVEYFKEGQGWHEQKASDIWKRTFMSIVVAV